MENIKTSVSEPLKKVEKFLPVSEVKNLEDYEKLKKMKEKKNNK